MKRVIPYFKNKFNDFFKNKEKRLLLSQLIFGLLIFMFFYSLSLVSKGWNLKSIIFVIITILIYFFHKRISLMEHEKLEHYCDQLMKSIDAGINIQDNFKNFNDNLNRYSENLDGEYAKAVISRLIKYNTFILAPLLEGGLDYIKEDYKAFLTLLKKEFSKKEINYYSIYNNLHNFHTKLLYPKLEVRNILNLLYYEKYTLDNATILLYQIEKEEEKNKFGNKFSKFIKGYSLIIGPALAYVVWELLKVLLKKYNFIS